MSPGSSRGGAASAIWKYLPAFGVLLVLYLVAVITGGPELLKSHAFSTGMPSGGRLTVDWGDMLIAAGIICLLVETIKATRTHTGAIVDHMASMLVFVVFLVLLIVWQGAATGTFCILTLMALLDVVGGFTVTIVASRRDFAVDPRAQG